MNLLRLLADGQIHSGVELAQQLNVSRMSVSNYVAGWVRRGAEIETLPARGYRLRTPFVPLSVCDILKDKKLANWKVDIRDEVSSTNDLAREALLKDGHHVLCLAEFQSNGRGRRGRSWSAVPGGSFCGSWGMTVANGVSELQGLSLAVGVVVVEALQELGIPGVGLKWPNDLVTTRGKLGGILIEVSGEPEGPCQVIVGVGINIHLPESIKQTIDQPVTAIQDISRNSPDRNQLAATLCAHVCDLLETFPRSGLKPWLVRWSALDAFAGQEVLVTGGIAPIEGIASGINESGALLIRTTEGLVPCYGGELTVRRSA